MPAGLSKHNLLDIVIGWQGAEPAIRSRLLQAFCSGIRLRSLVSNTAALLIAIGFVLAQTRQLSHIVWLAAVILGGFLPRLYALHLRRGQRFDEAPERKALCFVAISALYGLIWGAGPFLILPDVSGSSVGILLVIMVFGTIMGPYATMPGILYVRFATTGLMTLVAIALYTSPQVTLFSIVMTVWLALRTDVWRSYHRSLREQLDLREKMERRQQALERAHHETRSANDSLKTMAETDALTGAANRRQFMARFRTLKGPAALVLIDVDSFKSINDGFGHQFGDEVLIRLVKMAKQCLRKDDLLARIGGDEFALILPEMEPEGAWRVCERLRKSLESHVFSSGNVSVRVTISLGIAVLPAGRAYSDQTALLVEADEALYAAKHEGRNRVAAQSITATSGPGRGAGPGIPA